MAKIKELSYTQLKKTCDPAVFKFKTTIPKIMLNTTTIIGPINALMLQTVLPKKLLLSFLSSVFGTDSVLKEIGFLEILTFEISMFELIFLYFRKNHLHLTILALS